MDSRESDSARGRVLALALHGPEGEPMTEIDSALVLHGAGLEGDRSGKGRRGVTLLSREQWDEVRSELGADLPWHTRRANVLVEGLTLRNTLGCRLRVGDAELFIHDETRPCALMDQLHPGLCATLALDCRGGVHGEVQVAGRVSIGDVVLVIRNP